MVTETTKWFHPRSSYPAWSTELAEKVLQSTHPAPYSPQRLLQTLIILQQQFGHIPPRVQQWIARKSDGNAADIRSLISFYHFLSEEPPAAYHLRFADNVIERLAGLESVLATVRDLLCGTDSVIETTSCIGLSDQPLAVLVNGFAVTQLSINNVQEFCQLIRSNTPLQNWPKSWFRVNNVIRHKGLLTSYTYKKGQALQQCNGLSREQIIHRVGGANLRGLGGAGFPTAFKWHWCEQQADPTKYVICNADEGEPGTFKDRFYLTMQMDRVIEGMAIAAKAVGAQKGYIYLRGEYLYLYPTIEATLENWRQSGLLGEHFDIELHMGAGAYVCGEESALIESLEGKRGIPTNKPPYPGEKGLFGKPSIVNNVETFVAVTYLLQEGNEHFCRLGTDRSKGSRLHSVSGDCQQPGLYELEQGATLATLLQLCGAQTPRWVQVGGPSGQLISSAEFSTQLDFESPGHGGSIMVFDQSRSLAEITRNFTEFFRHESCGFCTPCRAGTVALCNLLDRYGQNPELSAQAGTDILELSNLMMQSSHCGLGKSAGQPAVSLLKWAEHNEL